MLKQFIIIFLILAINITIAQDLPDFLRIESKQAPLSSEDTLLNQHKLNMLQKYGEVEKRTYDVLDYDYYIDLSRALNATLESPKEERKSFWGSNLITVVMLNSTNELEFDAENMTIDSVVFFNHSAVLQPANTDYTITNGTLKLLYPTQLQVGDTLSVKIMFSAVADDAKFYRNNRGLHIFPKGYDINEMDTHGNKVIVEHNIAFSMSEPELARYWMPCNDRPYDKSTSSISVTVPLGYNVASNGYLAQIDTLPNNKATYHWRNDYPITTYLMCFAASVFGEYHQTAIVGGDTIPIVHYAWPEDFDGDYFKLISSMDTEPQLLDALVRNYGPYPFDKYGTVSVYPFYYGGMEHQTMVTQNRLWLRDYGDAGFVHEMGHHWFGDMMTCATWADVWINEGGASFTEAIYFGDLDSARYRSSIESKIVSYFRYNNLNNGGSAYAVPTTTMFGGESYLIYSKGAIIFNQLRLNLGDNEFFKILREIFQDWKFKSITTDQFRQAWKNKAQNPIVDIDTFFNQWVYGAGHPEYRIATILRGMSNDKYRFEITLSQLQSKNSSANPKVPDFFITPVRFKFQNGDTTNYSELFLNDKQNQTFEVLLDYIPTKVDIDQLSVVHETVSRLMSAVPLSDYVGGIDLFPNPATQGYAQLNLNLKTNIRNAKIELSDLLGNRIETIYDGSIYAGSIGYKIFTNNLPKGIYIVNISLDSTHISKKLIVQ